MRTNYVAVPPGFDPNNPEHMQAARAAAELIVPDMSLRDWFAGQALAGELASDTDDYPSPEKLAFRAYHYADMMIRERDMKRGASSGSEPEVSGENA